MYRKGIAVLVLFILLAGCQPVDFELEPYEPISSQVTNEVDEPEETEETRESSENTRPLYVSNAKPRELHLQSVNTTILSPIVKYCWSEGSGECPQELNQDPKEFLAIFGVRNASVKPSERFFYNMHSSNGINSPLPFPTSMQMYSYKDDAFLPLGEEIKDTENWEIPIQAPAEEGLYVYVVKATYEGDINGVTFYAFQFRVRA
ncbi:hypothetical protein ACFO0S_01645 [Chryseomicrobium palamuruense]|uniref:Lipoprotein n=1 Tax=Chryseomicrobium palamuruense TaxID=682973 RepID=A0ABV8UR41_9BACL